jgi:signal-transduction protein with cAMP-binding, CBS, and nucleotidyltransferase domain
MVIECKHVWGYISGYLDAALPEDIRLDVQKHLEHCEICSAILTADERVFKLPVGFSERLHARIDLELQGTGRG